VARTTSLAGSAAGLPPAAAAAAAVPKVVPEQCLLLASRPLDVAAELALQLEYTAGNRAFVFTRFERCHVMFVTMCL
jgi:hypothetical protein